MNYRDIINILAARYDAGEAKAVARLLLEKQFGLSWTDALCGGVEGLNQEQVACMQTSLQRLENGEPVQYVIGEADFYDRSFHVEPGVLIPRIETEELISEIITSVEAVDSADRIKVLDIGTGSGCIAITLALELERLGRDYAVEAVDISDEALRIASGNAERLSVNYLTFRKVDILDTCETSALPSDYSIIVSNPPYICNKEREEMEAHVLEHEPEQALFVPDDDPLLFYRCITNFASSHLMPGGKLFFEINRAYGKEMVELLKNNGFADVQLIKDQFGNDRMVRGVYG